MTFELYAYVCVIELAILLNIKLTKADH